jgi:hypothetical protein
MGSESAASVGDTGRAWRRVVRILVLFGAALVLAVSGGNVVGAQEVPPVVPATDPPPVTDPPPPPAPEPPPDPFAAWPLPGGSGEGRRVVYSISQQRVWWVEADGRVVHTYLVSGRNNTPARGTYAVYSKSRYASSGSARMEYMVRFAWGSSMAIGFHSIPTVGGRPLQSEGELGSFRSHGCVRQRMGDAMLLWYWAPVGTRVDVVK